MENLAFALYVLGAASICAATGYLHAKTTIGYNRRDIVLQTAIVAALWPLLLFSWAFIGFGQTIAEDQIAKERMTTRVNIKV